MGWISTHSQAYTWPPSSPGPPSSTPAVSIGPSASTLTSAATGKRLETPGATARAQVGYGLLDPSGSRPVWNLAEEAAENSPPFLFDASCKSYGWIVAKDHVNGAPGPGGLLLDCTVVTVFFTDDATPLPPPDMAEQLASIYATKEGADVTYSVDGVLFNAHKLVLAMGSPVFRAALFGDMAEGKRKVIKVQGMQSKDFKALLDYIYTDKLPSTDDCENDEDATKMIRGLLTAADRYCVGRLKLLCEHELCKALTVDNVAKMLELANDLHSDVLKDACIDFIVTDNRMDRVKLSEGYMELRQTNPSIFLEVLEKSNQFQSVGLDLSSAHVDLACVVPSREEVLYI
ncbi:hypothetical protein EJB05_08414, partial [Eragrostis curvula]